MAQCRISGKIIDGQGAAISGANVFLQDSYDGASSSSGGNFEFYSTEVANKVLVATFIGYKNFYREISPCNASGITIIMEDTISELEAVTITAGAFTASENSRRTVFRAVDIASTAGATADIAGALNTLPGTQKVGETGRLFVRGGDDQETRTFIDGQVVLEAYGTSAPNTPSRGRFLPFMFKGTSFSTGGYSSEYGQALSSALVLDSKDKAESTRTDIGLLSVGADVAHTQAWERGSLAGKVQYTNIRPYFGLISQETDWETPPAAIEGVAAFRQQVGQNGLLKGYGNFNHSHFSMYSHSINNTALKALYDLTNDYCYLNGSYKDVLSDTWSIRGGISYNSIAANTSINDENIQATESGIHGKAVAEGSLSEKVELRTGAEVIQRRYSEYVDLNSGADYTLGFDEWISAGFGEVDVYASNRFVSRAGVRLEYNNLLQRASVDPRVSLAFKTGSNGQISFAYGTFRQSPKNNLIKINHRVGTEKAEHWILNYQLVENNRTFRIETYYKQYDDLVKFSNENPLQLTNSGKGFARGVELFWRDNRSFRNVDYWVSYSFLDTERDYLNFPHEAVPSFASAHNFSLVYKHFIPAIKSQLGMTYSYTSGRPYNDPNTEIFNGKKTPYYADLSTNIAYLPKPFLILYVSCTNLLGRDNIFGYEYSALPDSNGLYTGRAIRQPAPRFLFIGIFITLSKDKSVNQLPSL